MDPSPLLGHVSSVTSKTKLGIVPSSTRRYSIGTVIRIGNDALIGSARECSCAILVLHKGIIPLKGIGRYPVAGIHSYGAITRFRKWTIGIVNNSIGCFDRN